MIRQLIIWLATVVTFAGLTGCLEASFDLSNESRLPRWFDVPPNSDRANLGVTMDYYSTLSGGEYIFRLYDKRAHTEVSRISVDIAKHPESRTFQLENNSGGSSKGYPAYNLVTVNGVSDIVERRGREPYFYMTDDPAVWKVTSQRN